MQQETRTRVVLFGSLGVAVSCLDWLLQNQQYEVLGVVCTRQPLSPWRIATGDADMQEMASQRGVPILSMDDILNIHADIGLSVRFHQILRTEHINRFKLGVVNLHGAPLPEMRGSMCDAAAILEGRKEYGTSLHWMDEGIDSGPVLAVHRFPIEANHTVYDLFQLSNALGLDLIRQNLNKIVGGELSSVPQDQLIQENKVESRTYYANQVKRYKLIPPGLSSEEVERRLRAFRFPGHEPPRYQYESVIDKQARSFEQEGVT